MMVGKSKQVHIDMYVKIYVCVYYVCHIGTNFVRTLKTLIGAPCLVADNLKLFGCI